MPEFNAVENTLFIPMLGRIYISEHFQNILYDEKALSLKDVLPKSLVETGSQSQYTLLASASRSANMDRYIRDFLRRKPDGVIAELGCGLETAFYRNDDGHTHWYAVDLPDVMEYRKTLLPEPNGRHTFPAMPFQMAGLGRFVSMHRMRRCWLLPAVCSIILKRKKCLPFCGCCETSEIWR